jgi:hypothetical protein
MSTKKRVVQRLVSFDTSNRDVKALDKELIGGWSIVSIVPHQSSFLLVLEKDEDVKNRKPNDISVKDTLSIISARSKNKKLLAMTSD